QPALIERRLRGIERLAREAERISRARDLLTLQTHAADHLVLDLHEIACVKELRSGERRIGHRFRSRVEATRLAQRADLRIISLTCRHLASKVRCQDNYARPQYRCQCRHLHNGSQSLISVSQAWRAACRCELTKRA